MTDPVAAGIQAGERGVDLGELRPGMVAEGEVALLLEDVGRRRGLRAVRHLAGSFDRLAELLEQSSPLRHELAALRLEVETAIHGRMLLNQEDCAMAELQTDPVCGMQVDPEAKPELRLEYEGKTYHFCSKGCLFEFRDDPKTYLDPAYVPEGM